jgi:hypothetical protein
LEEIYHGAKQGALGVYMTLWCEAGSRRDFLADWVRPVGSTIDYKCVDSGFPVSVSCVTISNHDLISSSETEVNPGIRSWKKHLSEWPRCQKATDSFYFTKKWRAETLQPGLEFDNIKPWPKSSIFICISWLNSSCFGGDDRGFLKEVVKAYLMAPMSPLINSPTFVFLRIYSLLGSMTRWFTAPRARPGVNCTYYTYY